MILDIVPYINQVMNAIKRPSPNTGHEQSDSLASVIYKDSQTRDAELQRLKDAEIQRLTRLLDEMDSRLTSEREANIKQRLKSHYQLVMEQNRAEELGEELERARSAARRAKGEHDRRVTELETQLAAASVPSYDPITALRSK